MRSLLKDSKKSLCEYTCLFSSALDNFLKVSFTCFHISLKVRYTQLVRQKWKPGGRARSSAGGMGASGGGALGRSCHGGSRRSGYAFAHQEGFGELITSGKNMRLSSLALATFASRHSTSWIETLRKKKQTAASTTQNIPSNSQALPLSTSSFVIGPQETCSESVGKTNMNTVPSNSLSDVQLSMTNIAQVEIEATIL